MVYRDEAKPALIMNSWVHLGTDWGMSQQAQMRTAEAMEICGGCVLRIVETLLHQPSGYTSSLTPMYPTHPYPPSSRRELYRGYPHPPPSDPSKITMIFIPNVKIEDLRQSLFTEFTEEKIK